MTKILGFLIIFTWFIGVGFCVLEASGNWYFTIAVVVCGVLIDCSLIHHASKVKADLSTNSANVLVNQIKHNKMVIDRLDDIESRAIFSNSSGAAKH